MVMERAIFMDRDGTLIKLVDTNGVLEPPRLPEQVEFHDYAVKFMKELQNIGYKLYIVSNQPDIAKRKQTAEQVFAVRDRFKHMIDNHNITITRYYYCYHHPEGSHPIYSQKCTCRKPAPGFILDARAQDHLDLDDSWIIGDLPKDIECGKNAGVRGILVGRNGVSLQRAYEMIMGWI